MDKVMSAAGRAFLRTFAAAMVALAPGILAAPDLHSAALLGVAALMAAVAMGVRSLQAYVPQLSFDSLVGPDVGRYLDSFAQAFVGALVVSLPGLLKYPDQGNWKALGAALVVAVLASLSRGVQALGTKGETVTSASKEGAAGLLDPKNP